MVAWYNEHDPKAAAWLRELIAQGLIAPGVVDERSIVDVQPRDLDGFTQCHFFAGIGGWSLALRLAMWPDGRPVWTGSCPCQPFSNAGKRAGFDDERHLWPVWKHLIEKRRPAVVFGEQVAGASDWLRLVRGDMEAVDYALGAVPVEAASAGAPDYRDRYWFVAVDNLAVVRWEPSAREQPEPQQNHVDCPRAISDGDDAQRRAVGPRGHDDGRTPPGRHQGDGDAAERRARALFDRSGFGWGEGWTEDGFRQWSNNSAAAASLGNSQIVLCPDGKWRPLPPSGVRWLGNGIPARVAKLRGLGNAIDPRPASAFIAAADEAMRAAA